MLWLECGCSGHGHYCNLYYAVRWMNFHLNAHVASGKLELNHQCVTRVRMHTIMIVLRRFKLLDLDFLIVQGTEKSLLDVLRFDHDLF